MDHVHNRNPKPMQDIAHRRRNQRKDVVYICNIGTKVPHQVCDLSSRAPGVYCLYSESEFLPQGGRFNLTAMPCISHYICILRKQPHVCLKHGIGPSILLKLVVYAQDAHCRELNLRRRLWMSFGGVNPPGATAVRTALTGATYQFRSSVSPNAGS